ncbi:hypothetical protein HGI30_03905 [Paenibacillus albicereus]|uniref:Uncharacterized protein n=1 Tax=Paenibacillus albicereus TaxID=2726185 RepID=A0A6H2GTN7_9BACL|nr:hypothetical protein [Paenibacillus albicereus]QJC50794.1 hypothetical protein HGI30_03905 [Paenibacillus albicereus]
MFPVWVYWIPSLLTVAGLVWLYRKSSPDEPNRGWKLFGYVVLGAFSFRFDTFSIPLGFLLCIPLIVGTRRNFKAKRAAAIIGLAVFAAGVAIPALEESLFERQRSFAVQSGPQERIDLAGDWRRMAEGSDSSGRLERFELVQEPDGRIRSLQYHVAARDGRGAYEIEVRYAPEKGQAVLERTRIFSPHAQAALALPGVSSTIGQADPESFLKLLSPDNLKQIAEEAQSGSAPLQELELTFFNGQAAPVEPSPIRRLLGADGVKPAGEEPIHGYILQARGKTDSPDGMEDKFIWHVIPTYEVQKG